MIPINSETNNDVYSTGENRQAHTSLGLGSGRSEDPTEVVGTVFATG